MEDVLLGTGRRKTSVARVMLSEGSGEYTFNGKNIEEYFPSPSMRMKINKPFEVVDLENDSSGRIDGAVPPEPPVLV